MKYRIFGMPVLLIFCGITAFFSSCSVNITNEQAEAPVYTAGLNLSNFSYTGASTAYILLRTQRVYSGQYDQYQQDIGEALYNHGTAITSPGTSDIVFSDIEFPGSTDPNNNVQLVTWLLCASDEDGSGDLNDGDIYMPEYGFLLNDGDSITLPDLTFDTGSALVADVIGGGNSNYQSRTFDINIDVPDSDGTVYLFIEDSPDLSLGTYERRIPVPSSVITELRITTFPDDAPRDLYLLLFQDTNDNGQPDTGEPASADVPVTSVPFGFHIDPGAGDDGNAIQLSLSGAHSVQ